MKKFHITYFLEGRDTPTLTGITMEAICMRSLLNEIWERDLININDIKYIIEI